MSRPMLLALFYRPTLFQLYAMQSEIWLVTDRVSAISIYLSYYSFGYECGAHLTICLCHCALEACHRRFEPDMVLSTKSVYSAELTVPGKF